MAWPIWAAMAAGAALGAVRSREQQKQADKQRKLQAAVAQNMHWTGMTPNLQAFQGPDTMGNMMQGAAQGAMFNEQFGGAETPEITPAAQPAAMPQQGPMSPYDPQRQQYPWAYDEMGREQAWSSLKQR